VTGADHRGRLAGLTGREREILGHLLAGRTNAEIARELVISDKTVSVHVSNILRKTGTTNRAEAAALAHRLM
jgi:DNA-binding NarL/FixJ family response regulator